MCSCAKWLVVGGGGGAGGGGGRCIIMFVARVPRPLPATVREIREAVAASYHNPAILWSAVSLIYEGKRLDDAATVQVL